MRVGMDAVDAAGIARAPLRRCGARCWPRSPRCRGSRSRCGCPRGRRRGGNRGRCPRPAPPCAAARAPSGRRRRPRAPCAGFACGPTGRAGSPGWRGRWGSRTCAPFRRRRSRAAPACGRVPPRRRRAGSRPRPRSRRPRAGRPAPRPRRRAHRRGARGAGPWQDSRTSAMTRRRGGGPVRLAEVTGVIPVPSGPGRRRRRRRLQATHRSRPRECIESTRETRTG